MTNILGISSYYHDSAACLVQDGRIVAAAQEERFTRVKHDQRFPGEAVAYCLREAGIAPADLSAVVFYDKPWLKFERLLSTYLAFAPSGLSSFMKAMPLWLKEKLWLEDHIRSEIGYEGKLLYTAHHQAHAASAFFPSPFERAAILTVDGVGEWATASWGVGQGNSVEIHSELQFPHSLGLLYSAFTFYTGFKVNSGEYKVMGLAPYGEPTYVDLILKHLVDVREDGSLRMDMKYFNYCQGLTMTSPAFHELFGGPPRMPESTITQREMDLARSVQDVTELVMLRMARHVRKTTGERNLCLAGGVALNCVANGKILREKIFDHIWIQPAAGDAGGALGAALFTWHQSMGNPRETPKGRDSQHGSYLGPAYSPSDIKAWLTKAGRPFHEHTPDEVPAIVAKLLDEQSVVGWFSGRMEFGPRALGARSILGDARSPKMQAIMNLKIKFRESFRPFAPACLLEDVSHLFELDEPSPYMLIVADVAEQHRVPMTPGQAVLFGIDKLNVPRSKYPAVTHVDYSARIQTVDEVDHPQFHRLLKAFKERAGAGVIINTSFNVRGEPIVCTPQEAFQCFMRTGMDALVLENCILYKKEQPPLVDDEDWRRQYQLD